MTCPEDCPQAECGLRFRPEAAEEIDADTGMKGTRRAYGKKHERKRIGREARKSARHRLRAMFP